MINVKHYAKALLADEFSTHKHHQWHLKGLLYELKKLQLQQACVAGTKEYQDVCDYHNLQGLITQVNNRIQYCQGSLK